MATMFIDGTRQTTINVLDAWTTAPVLGEILTGVTSGATMFVLSTTTYSVTGWADGTFIQGSPGETITSSGAMAPTPATLIIGGTNVTVDGTTWETAYEGPYGVQAAVNSIGVAGANTLYVRNNFDSATYGLSVNLDTFGGVIASNLFFEIIAVDLTGSGSTSGTRLPVGTFVVFDGGGTLTTSIFTWESLPNTRLIGIRGTDTDSLINSNGFTRGSTALTVYGLCFINCEFDKCYRGIDISAITSTYARGVCLTFCIIENNAENGFYDYSLYGTVNICCTFTANALQKGYYAAGVGNQSFYGCLFIGGDYGIYKAASGPLAVFNCTFYNHTITSIIMGSSRMQLVEFGNVYYTNTPTSDMPIKTTTGSIAFSNFSITNATEVGDLLTDQTVPLGSVSGALDGQTITFVDEANDDLRLVDLGQYFAGMRDLLDVDGVRGYNVLNKETVRGRVRPIHV